MRNLKIYVADDHTLYRTALINLLRDFKRVSKIDEACNGRELLKLMRNELPDMVILDLEMPVMDGIKACEKIVEEFPEVKIIVVSMHDSKLQISQLLQMGAHAFLSKNSQAIEFESAIYSVVDKGIYRNEIMEDALKIPVNVNRKIPLRRTKAELSKKERTIVQLLAQGLTSRQIGTALSLSEFTVRNHKTRIMRKMGLKDSADLMKLVFNKIFKFF